KEHSMPKRPLRWPRIESELWLVQTFDSLRISRTEGRSMPLQRSQAATYLVLVAMLTLGVCHARTGRAAEDIRLERIATIESKGKTGTLDHLFVDSSTSRLFLTNQTNDTLDVIDLKINRLLKQVPDQKTAHSVVFVPGLSRIFVGCGGGFC